MNYVMSEDGSKSRDRRAASVAIVAGLLQGFLPSSAASADGTLILRSSAPSGAEDAGTILSPRALQEIARVEAEIDRTETQAIEKLATLPGDQIQQIELLGKLMLYDKQLSVNRNEACAFCHTPETGFTGPVSELNRTTASYPGSVRTRFSNRKPQSHAYAPLSPVLHYNPGQRDLVGGNFWDMRATGRRLGNPAAEQAEGPPTNPVEMGLQRAISEPQPTRGFPTTRKSSPTHWAMSPIRRVHHSSTAASAIFSPRRISSANPPPWISGGSSWRPTTKREFKFPHSAMWTSGPTRAL
jgi:Di-haem cytochrome c peroxidase